MKATKAWHSRWIRSCNPLFTNTLLHSCPVHEVRHACHYTKSAAFFAAAESCMPGGVHGAECSSSMRSFQQSLLRAAPRLHETCVSPARRFQRTIEVLGLWLVASFCPEQVQLRFEPPAFHESGPTKSMQTVSIERSTRPCCRLAWANSCPLPLGTCSLV